MTKEWLVAFRLLDQLQREFLSRIYHRHHFMALRLKRFSRSVFEQVCPTPEKTVSAWAGHRAALNAKQVRQLSGTGISKAAIARKLSTQTLHENGALNGWIVAYP
jgi:hypothetical protein